MEQNLDMALRSVLGAQVFARQTGASSFAQTEDISELGAMALEHYNKAKEYLQQGNWAGYGRELDNLEKILQEISSKAQQNKQ